MSFFFSGKRWVRYDRNGPTSRQLDKFYATFNQCMIAHFSLSEFSSHKIEVIIRELSKKNFKLFNAFLDFFHIRRQLFDSKYHCMTNKISVWIKILSTLPRDFKSNNETEPIPLFHVFFNDQNNGLFPLFMFRYLGRRF